MKLNKTQKVCIQKRFYELLQKGMADAMPF